MEERRAAPEAIGNLRLIKTERSVSGKHIPLSFERPYLILIEGIARFRLAGIIEFGNPIIRVAISPANNDNSNGSEQIVNWDIRDNWQIEGTDVTLRAFFSKKNLNRNKVGNSIHKVVFIISAPRDTIIKTEPPNINT
ncbi:hypothetical protein A3D07_02820 [Candidatus Curtissbacteria bacterium RIFCSPHIGHO2_02_FULL_42_15]|uniref:Uncharacterized protein n=1 Tax=Candidatus Curtissbacteria bacterium RIFCSPHIGHO2_02_FULL_42_15 TaxID=1797716 RepID=A0A1F5GCV2_9BACT|nr:MAG: hypothetical protein A3D07_02820 [Candidatus Curtissbacteria bacterium RIFCSPHIGHO2_02_FULL_42_15]